MEVMVNVWNAVVGMIPTVFGLACKLAGNVTDVVTF